jgi:two-component system chemotaxis sensor kinase CheA
VRTNIEKIGGTIDLHGVRGVGTTIKIKIPLTLAIIPALVVASGDNRYAIPQASLVELVRLEGDEARDGVELLYGAPVYRLRGKLLPLVYLSDALHTRDDRAPDHDVVNIIVLAADDQQFGVVVHDVHDTEEIVVKPLGKHLQGIPVFAGATIMGDGLVALILDILGLAKHTGVVAEGRERARLDAMAAPVVGRDDHQTMLVFRASEDSRMAIPLSRVARLEELACTTIERIGHELVVQYRGEIMPLLDLSQLLGEGQSTSRIGKAAEPGALLQVVVFAHRGVHIGLIVGDIVDIVDDALSQQRPPGRPGVLGSAVIAGRVTELLDVEAVLQHAQPLTGWPDGSRSLTAGAGDEVFHVA